MGSELISEINMLVLDDLQEEYKKLFASYQHLNKIHDSDLQQIYELQRNLKISKAAEEHLCQELESISSLQNFDSEKLNRKYSQELEECKRKNKDLEDYIDILEKKLENLTSENQQLQEQLIEISTCLKNENEIRKNYISNENQEKLECENLELLAKLNESQEFIQKSYIAFAEKERQIEVLKEEIQCYQENLLTKKEELEEKTSLLDSLQERIIEMNNEIMSLRSQPENENRKGNSLFAEVDDQRQEMKRTLLAQKKCYLQMKKIYNESQFEIRRLKRENSAMQSEIQACSSIFLNSKKFYEEKLVQRISVLSNENNELEKKLNISQNRLISLAEKNEITWLDSLMSFCKNETNELKSQLQNIRLQKGIIEKNYRDSQEELAKWRFEALKSRCIIIDRESLLDENSINYKSFNEMKIKLNEENIPKSIPQIQSPINDLKIKMNLCSNKELKFDPLKQDCEDPQIQICTEKILNNKSSVSKTITNLTETLKSDIISNAKLSSESHESTNCHNSKIFEVFEDITNSENEFSQIKKKTNEINKIEKENNETLLNECNSKNSISEHSKFNKKEETTLETFKVCQQEEKELNPSEIKIITKKTKSNIIIKKLVIKSKEQKIN